MPRGAREAPATAGTALLRPPRRLPWQVKGIRSWQLSMMLTLQMAAYTDGLSCFNFTEPFAGMHCEAMVRPAPTLPRLF